MTKAALNSFAFLNCQINAVASDPSNKVYIKSVVKNSNGKIMPGAKIEITIEEAR